jgi:hypothetical protein
LLLSFRLFVALRVGVISGMVGIDDYFNGFAFLTESVEVRVGLPVF